MSDKGSETMMKRQEVRIIIEVLAGIVISVILNSIMISIGYMFVNSQGLKNYDVSILGMDIFKITNGGATGEPITSNMIFIGVACSIILVVIIEIIIENKRRSR